MVILDQGTGFDITPSTTGFYSIQASGGPFSLRSYICGTDMFSTISTGSYINIPYYLSYGDCIQLYNGGNTSTDVSYSISNNSPATTLVSVSISIWFLLLLFSYLVLLFISYKGTVYIVDRWKKEPERRSNHIPEYIPSISPTAPIQV